MQVSRPCHGGESAEPTLNITHRSAANSCALCQFILSPSACATIPSHQGRKVRLSLGHHHTSLPCCRIRPCIKTGVRKTLTVRMGHVVPMSERSYYN